VRAVQAPETDPDRGHSAAASNSVAPFSFLSPPFLAFSIIIKVVVSTFLYLFFFLLIIVSLCLACVYRKGPPAQMSPAGRKHPSIDNHSRLLTRLPDPDPLSA
jgi:hypothetical protein